MKGPNMPKSQLKLSLAMKYSLQRLQRGLPSQAGVQTLIALKYRGLISIDKNQVRLTEAGKNWRE